MTLFLLYKPPAARCFLLFKVKILESHTANCLKRNIKLTNSYSRRRRNNKHSVFSVFSVVGNESQTRPKMQHVASGGLYQTNLCVLCVLRALCVKPTLCLLRLHGAFFKLRVFKKLSRLRMSIHLFFIVLEKFQVEHSGNQVKRAGRNVGQQVSSP